MAWGKGGSKTLDATATQFDITGLSSESTNLIVHSFPSGASAPRTFEVNGTSGTYDVGNCDGGGAIGHSPNYAGSLCDQGGSWGDDAFIVGYMMSIEGKEKIMIYDTVGSNSNGTAPRRRAWASRSNSNTGALTSVTVETSGGSGSIAGSNFSILGSDKTPTLGRPISIQDNSILVEKDTGKRYWFDVSKDTTKDGTNSNITLDTTNEKLGTGCYDFNGSTSRSVTSVKFNGLHDGTGGSISFWMRPRNMSSIHGNGDIIFDSMATSAANGTGISILIKNTSLLRLNYTTSSNAWFTDINSTTTFSDNTWYHVVITFGSNTVNLYINGSQEDTATFSNPNTSASNGDFVIGSHSTDPSSYGYYDGLLDDTGIWNRVITSSEVTSLYNSGTGALSSSISTTDLTGYYNYDAVTGDKLENELTTATWTKSLGGFALIYGGGGSSTEKFSWATKTTAGGTALAQNYEGASALCNGAVAGFFAGGTGGSYISTVFKYNYSDSAITTKSATTSAIHSWGGSWSTPTIGYVVRGNNNGGYGNTVEKYNYAGDSMSSGTSLNNGSSETTTHQTSTVGFATGRWSGSSSGDTEKYTFSSDAKTTGTSLITATSKSGAGTTTATGLIAGGQTGNGTGYQSRIEKYDETKC